jgi:hypothetical protein
MDKRQAERSWELWPQSDYWIHIIYRRTETGRKNKKLEERSFKD